MNYLANPWLILFTLPLYVSGVARSLKKRLRFFSIIGFVQTQVLRSLLSRLWTRHQHAFFSNQMLKTCDIVAVCSTQMHRQRHATPVNQQVSLGPHLAPVSGVGSGLVASQRSRSQLGVRRLPLSVNASDLIVPPKHHFHDGLDDT